jgi:O-antigen ligase
MADFKLAGKSSVTGQMGPLFLASAFLFRLGLASETFEIIRPMGILVADYFFFSSLILLLWGRGRRLLKSTGSGILTASFAILCGAMLSMVSASNASAAADPAMRLFILFGLFAPLAIVHAPNFRQNLLFLVGGVTANCCIAILSVSVSSDIPQALAIAPRVDVYSGPNAVRFAGLAGHPNILGLSAALAILIAVGLLFSEKKIYVRRALLVQILICAFGAFLSGSRTFWASLVPGLIVLIVWQKLSLRMLARFCVGLVGVFAVWVAANRVVPDLAPHYQERLAATNSEDAENYGRLLTAGLALQEISQKPFLGWGIDRFGEAGMMFLPEDNEFLPAHVSFLQYWYAGGFLGALGFLMLFVVPVKKMLQALKKTPSDGFANALRLGLSVYISLFITSSLHAILLNRFLYVPLFIFAGLTANVRGTASERVPARQPVANFSPANIRTTA